MSPWGFEPRTLPLRAGASSEFISNHDHYFPLHSSKTIRLLPYTCWNYFSWYVLMNTRIDTWLRLHARMVVMLPKFNRTTQTCCKKFNQIFAAYKEDKLANGISCNNQQENKFYDSLDQWYHQAGQVLKHVSTTTNDSADCPTNSSPKVDSAPISTPLSI